MVVSGVSQAESMMFLQWDYLAVLVFERLFQKRRCILLGCHIHPESQKEGNCQKANKCSHKLQELGTYVIVLQCRDGAFNGINVYGF